jgi:hypothetical protein
MSSYTLVIHQGGEHRSLRGSVDRARRQITLPAPGNRRLLVDDIASAVATFAVTPGTRSVTVDGVEQASGSTANDLRRAITYTLAGEAGDTVTYTLLPPPVPQATGLPVIHVNTGGAPIPDKEHYVPCTLTIADPADPGNDRAITLASDGIRLRGNTTMGYAKKPYRLKFDKKVSLFGLGAAKSWVLLANYLDPTLLTATVAFELGNRFAARRQGTRPFVNSARHVELFVNGDHAGSYLLTEQVQVNEHRVNIDEDDDYLLELDSYYDEENKFMITLLPGGTALPVNIQSPEDDAGAAALPAIRASVQALVDRLSNNGRFDRPDDAYRELVDIASAVDFIMINEITGNGELQHPKSTYIYKTAGGRWNFGPLWDFDWAFGYTGGNFTYFSKASTLFFGPATNFRGDPRAGNVFFSLFFLDPVFRAAYKARWNEMKPHFSTIDAFIEERGRYLEQSAARNKERWSAYYSSIDYPAEIARMKRYMTDRVSYLDGMINASSW